MRCERGRSIRDVMQHGRECRGILHRLAAALAEIRRHGVRGIAQQHRRAAAEARQRRRQLLDRQPGDGVVIGRFDQCPHRGVPVAEPAQHLGSFVGEGDVARHGGDGEPVHASVREGCDSEALTDTPGLSGLLKIESLGGDAAPGRVTGVSDTWVIGPGRSDAAAQTVRRDDQVEPIVVCPSGLLDTHDPVAHRGDRRTGANVDVGGFAHEHPVERGSIDDSGSVCRSVRQRDKPRPVGSSLPGAQTLRPCRRDLPELLPQPEVVERSTPVAEDRQAGPARTHLARSLED